MPSDNRTRARVTLSGVRDAYFRGEFEGVLAMSDALRPRDEVDAVEAALLRSRALLALNRSEQALGALRALRLVERPRDEYLTAQMLTGAAFSKLDQGARAVEILREARASASSAHPTVRAEIALHLGIAHFRRGEHADAERLLSEVPPDADIVYAHGSNTAHGQRMRAGSTSPPRRCSRTHSRRSRGAATTTASWRARRCSGSQCSSPTSRASTGGPTSASASALSTGARPG